MFDTPEGIAFTMRHDFGLLAGAERAAVLAEATQIWTHHVKPHLDDLENAAGECLVALPEPGSDLAAAVPGVARVDAGTPKDAVDKLLGLLVDACGRLGPDLALSSLVGQIDPEGPGAEPEEEDHDV